MTTADAKFTDATMRQLQQLQARNLDLEEQAADWQARYQAARAALEMAVDAAVLAEREACAVTVERNAMYSHFTDYLARRIRARGGEVSE